MDIVKSDSIAFAYTVKALGAVNINKNHYDSFFQKLDKLGVKVEYKIGEKDSLGKLHYHGIIYVKKGFFRKRIMMKGYHVKLEEIYNKEGWVKYIHKDVQFDYLEEQAPSAAEDSEEEYIEHTEDDTFKWPSKSLFK